MAARALLLATALLGFVGCTGAPASRGPAGDPRLEERAREDEQLLETEEEMEPESDPDDGSFIGY